MKTMKNMLLHSFCTVVKGVAKVSAATTCIGYSYQPKTPRSLKK